MNQQTDEQSTAIKKRLIDGMVSYMAVEGVAEGYESFYGQADVDRCERLLDEFSEAVSRSKGDHGRVMEAVQGVVQSLNQLNDECDRSLIETDQREDICAFIEAVITERGVDIDALAVGRGCTRHEITDEWRDW